MSSPASIPEPAAHPVSGWKLTVLRADGSDAGTFEVPNEPTVVGREIGGIFGGDSYLSPRHALLFRRGGRLAVEDAGSLNGTYMRLKRDVSEKLSDGQMFRIGQEIIRFERLSPEPARDGVELMGSPSTGYVGRIVLVTGREATGNAFPVPQTGVHIGRERGHVLFPEDGYVSGLHCAITCDGNDVLLTDLGSSNGTFIRLVDERDVLEGDVILMGQQLFRAGK
jgi:pSer/pThr/pTyr-binding forkhead associated (FHA) protein